MWIYPGVVVWIYPGVVAWVYPGGGGVGIPRGCGVVEIKVCDDRVSGRTGRSMQGSLKDGALNARVY